jgi:hypothetical protein
MGSSGKVLDWRRFSENLADASNRSPGAWKSMKTLAPLVGACFALTACNAPAPQASAPLPPGSVAVTPPGFKLPEGTDCSAKIARYRAVQDNDLSMGHVVQSVYNQIKRETDAASKVCSAGRDTEAKSMVAASQKRHGYPTD